MARTPDQLNHILVPDQGFSESAPFSPPGAGGSPKAPAHVPDRHQHAAALLQQYKQVLDAAEPAMRDRAGLEGGNGYYLEIESRPNTVLLTDKLERRRFKTNLLSVRQEGQVTKATVFVPEKAKDLFDKLIQDYENKDEPLAKEPVPKGWKLIEGIAVFRNATLQDLWTGTPNDFPADGTVFGLGGMAS